jgi:glycosyltransferase involved in cell wall biosynthesis
MPVRRVLLISRYFPPIGGAGVHRTVGSVRHLPDHGYQPVLVTGSGHQRGRWDAHDPELLRRIPSDAEIHRIEAPEPEGPTGLAARVARVRPGIDAWVRWWIDQCVELGRAVGRDADLIVVSCAPYETALAGARLSAELGIPWVADLEDPWALDEMRLHPTGLHARADLRSMRRALASASAVIMAAPEAAVRVRAAMPELADRVVTGIEIGFEPEDFDVPRRGDGAFRVVHTGSMHTDLGMRMRATARRRRLLGGTFPGLDVMSRSHVYLAEAIARRDAPVELHLAGALTDADRAVAGDFIRPRGLLSHGETVALMRSADLLFLPMQDLPGRAGLIPYKTFEYLGARRPILAAVPDGDVRDMLSPLDHAHVVRPADVDAMAEVLSTEIARAPRPDSPPPSGLERAACVARIAAVLDEVLDRSKSASRLAA